MNRAPAPGTDDCRYLRATNGMPRFASLLPVVPDALVRSGFALLAAALGVPLVVPEPAVLPLEPVLPPPEAVLVLPPPDALPLLLELLLPELLLPELLLPAPGLPLPVSVDWPALLPVSDFVEPG